MKSKIRTYRAAGGVVLDDRRRVLLIERDVIRNDQPLHEIRLPKGHVEPGETDEQAALREVGEETGYWQLRIIADLGEAHTSYVFKEKQTERDEHYYLMALTSDRPTGQQMDPHKEEAKFKPLWAANLDQAQQLLTYDDEKQFIARARTALQKL